MKIAVLVTGLTGSLTSQKHWKKYFLEFLMIFLVVAAGFFAENYRELGGNVQDLFNLLI